MNRPVKIILSLVALAVILLVVVLVPFPEKSSVPIDESVLLVYDAVGGFGGVTERIKIFNDGSVEFNDGQKTFTSTVSAEQLQNLNQFIKQKEYSIKKQSLLQKWREPTVGDYLYTAVVISQDGEAVLIESNKVIFDIISQIREEARVQLS